MLACLSSYQKVGAPLWAQKFETTWKPSETSSPSKTKDKITKKNAFIFK